MCAIVKSGSSPGSGFTSGKGLRPRSGAIAEAVVAAAAAAETAAAPRARGAALGPAARSERQAPGSRVGEGRGERAARNQLLRWWRGRAGPKERDAKTQNSHAHRCAGGQPPANLRCWSPRSAVTTPQLHRRKLLKNGGRFPSSPPPARPRHTLTCSPVAPVANAPIGGELASAHSLLA